MQIKRIKLEGVTVHKSTEIEFPDRGIVLFSGKNGSGKTTIAEAVPMAIWGRTVKDRGQPIWAANKGGKIEVEANEKTYTRLQTGRVKLSFSDGKEYETTTHAQKEVNSHFGEFGTWKRSAVLSSQESAGFCGATDSEKKQMLEALTHSEAIAGAAEIAAKKSRESRDAWNQKDKEEAVQTANLASAKRSLLNSVPPDYDDTEIENHTYNEEAHELSISEKDRKKKALISSREHLIRVREKMADLNSEKKRIQKSKNSLKLGKCERCGQSVTEQLVENHLLESDKELASIENESENVLREGTEAKLAYEEASREHEDALRIEREHLAKRENRETLKKLKDVQKEAELRAEKVGEEYASAKLALKIAVEEKAKSATELAHVKEAHKVLGPKGMRAHLVSRTIKALESSANSWLSRIGDKDISLKMSAYGTKSDGSRKDEITVTATINGSSVSVKSASRGERRRIDIAICLALAEIAEASSGNDRSTIFADEIFDGLTAQGVSAVMNAMTDLAEDRCVVIMCPEPPHEVTIAASAHYKFEHGRVQRI